MEETNKPKFVTYFPTCQDVHLTKDVGMIPYIMQRDFGYDSYMMCYKNGDYPRLKTDVPGLKMQFLNHNVPRLERLTESLMDMPSLSGFIRLLCIFIDAFVALKKWGKEIDVLQLYHLKPESILVGVIYRAINRHGVLYLKLDMNMSSVEPYKERTKRLKALISLRYILFKLASFNVISVETKEVYVDAREFFPFFGYCRDRVHYIPNGIDIQSLSPVSKPFSDKSNKILHVGRIGARPKASELVLEAFSMVCKEFPGWRLELIGAIEDDFSEFLESFKSKNSYIMDSISYLGFLDTLRLYEHYSEAKILMAPSRWESFGFVVVEAGAFGDVILGSNIPSFRDLTDDGKLSYLCPVDSLECLTERLRYMLSHEDELEIKSHRISEFIRENFDWKAICRELNEIILQSFNP